MTGLFNGAIARIRLGAAGSSGRSVPARRHASWPVSARLSRRAGHWGERGGSVVYLLVMIFIISATVLVYYIKLEKGPQGPGPAAHELRPVVQAPEAVVEEQREIRIAVSSEAAGSADAEIAQATAAANAGDYERADMLLRGVMRRNPDSKQAAGTLAAVLNNAALQLSDKGRYAEAVDLLTEARDLSPSASIAKNLAYAQIKLNDLAGAAWTLEQVDADPSAQRTLGWIYYQLADEALNNHRRDSALKYYQKLDVLQPGDAHLRGFIAKLKAEAASEKGMGRAEGANFTVRYEGGENAVTGHVIGLLLEEAYHKVGSDLDFYPDDRIEAVLYLKEQFRDVTGSPSWAGAIYDGRIKVPAGGVTDKSALLEKVLFHEYTHAVVHRLSGARAPVWLNEGLAQIEEGKDDGGQRAALKRFAVEIKGKGGGVNVLRRLEGSFMGLDSNQAAWAYLLSLSATQYLTREFGVFSARRVLENLRDGKGLDDAVYDALSISYDNFCDAWLTSLKNS